jgi:hypothetical protein
VDADTPLPENTTKLEQPLSPVNHGVLDCDELRELLQVSELHL